MPLLTYLVPAGVLLVIVFFVGFLGVYLWNRRPRNFISAAAPEQTVKTVSELIPDSQFLDVDGVKLHYVQAGEGRDVVLLHGIGASVYSWRFLFPFLQTHYRVTAIDIAGFGESSKNRKLDYGIDAQSERLAKLLETIGIHKALLVGSSMGGAISLWLALKYPTRFERVVTLAPATDSAKVSRLYSQLGLAAPLLRPALNKHVMRRLLLNAIGHEVLITDQVVERYMKPFGDNGDSIRAFFAATRTLNDRRLPWALREMQAKVLVLWGARDRVVPRSTMTQLMTVLKDAEFVVSEMSGHHPMEDSPEWVARQIERFFPFD